MRRAPSLRRGRSRERVVARGERGDGGGRPAARRSAVRSRKATSTAMCRRGERRAPAWPHKGGRGGREEGGGDNINSADDKMMRGVFSLAEERTARIAGTRGGIEEGREGGSQSGVGNVERGRAFIVYAAALLHGSRGRTKCECGQKGNPRGDPPQSAASKVPIGLLKSHKQ